MGLIMGKDTEDDILAQKVIQALDLTLDDIDEFEDLFKDLDDEGIRALAALKKTLKKTDT